MVDKKEAFRFDLTDEHVDYYEKVKEINNFSKKVDVFRYAIQTTYELDIEGITPYTVVDRNLRRRIKKIVKRQDIQRKFNVYRYEDFLKNAIDSYLEKITTYMKTRSILHWDVRNSLDGDKKEVALGFREILLENPFGEVRVSQLLEHLNWRDREKLESILDDFVYQNLLEYEIIGNERVYTALDPEN